MISSLSPTDWLMIAIVAILVKLWILHEFLSRNEEELPKIEDSAEHVPYNEEAEAQYWGYLACKACGGSGPPSNVWGSQYMFDHAVEVLQKPRRTTCGTRWVIDPAVAYRRKNKYSRPCVSCGRRKRKPSRVAKTRHNWRGI